MRTHFSKAFNTPAPSNQPTLSLEEEAVLLQEIGDDKNAFNEFLDEDARVDDINVGMDDVASIVTGSENITPVETALVEIVGDMAVAGTDIDPADVLPIIPDGENTVSIEGIKETVNKIIEAIKAFFKKIWDYLSSFFDKSKNRNNAIIDKAETLKEDIEKKPSADVPTKTTFQYSGKVSNFCVDGKLSTNFLKDLVEVNYYITNVLEKLPNVILSLYEILEKNVKRDMLNPDSHDDDDLEEARNECSSVLVNLLGTKIGQSRTVKPFLGDIKFDTVDGSKPAEFDIKDNMEFPILDKKVLLGIASEVAGSCNKVKYILNKNEFKKVDEKQDQVLKDIAALCEKQDKQENSDRINTGLKIFTHVFKEMTKKFVKIQTMLLDHHASVNNSFNSYAKDVYYDSYLNK